jgi:hypothetical protein
MRGVATRSYSKSSFALFLAIGRPPTVFSDSSLQTDFDHPPEGACAQSFGFRAIFQISQTLLHS